MKNSILWNVFIIALIALFFAFLLNVNYKSAIAIFALTSLAFIYLSNDKLLLIIIVILSIFIEVSFQQLSFFSLEKSIINFNGVINLCIIAVTISYILVGKINPFRSYITKPFMLYLIIVILSLVVSTNYFLTLKSIVRISTAYCIYLMITQLVVDKNDIDRIFQIFLFLLFVPIIVGMYQIIFDNNFLLSRTIRIEGTFKNGQSYSMYLAFLLPFLFARLTSVKDIMWRKVFLFMIFFMGLMNLLFSSTRIGWGAFVLSILIYLVLSRKVKHLVAIITLFIFLVIVISPFFVKYFGPYFTTSWSSYLSSDVSDYMKPASYQTVSSLHIRVYVWKFMINEFIKKNPLLGLGSGTWFGFLSSKLHVPIASHNDYVEVLIGTGFLGLFFYLIFRFKQIGLLRRVNKLAKKYIENNTVILPALSVLIAFMFVSITEVWQAYVGLYWTSWIILGISECYYKYFLLKERSDEKIYDFDGREKGHR